MGIQKGLSESAHRERNRRNAGTGMGIVHGKPQPRDSNLRVGDDGPRGRSLHQPVMGNGEMRESLACGTSLVNVLVAK